MSDHPLPRHLDELGRRLDAAAAGLATPPRRRRRLVLRGPAWRVRHGLLVGLAVVAGSGGVATASKLIFAAPDLADLPPASVDRDATAAYSRAVERLLADHGLKNMRCGIDPGAPQACYHPDGRRWTGREALLVMCDPRWLDVRADLQARFPMRRTHLMVGLPASCPPD